jgi:hypothetical protein
LWEGFNREVGEIECLAVGVASVSANCVADSFAVLDPTIKMTPHLPIWRFAQN